MTDPNSDGNFPAFPCPRDDGFKGLTKREYIATQILAGLAANPDFGLITGVYDAIRLTDFLLEKLEGS